MFGGLNLLQTSALTMASQPSFSQPTHVFDINVPEGLNDIPLKFRQNQGLGMMPMGGIAGLPALPIFLPGSPMPGDTVVTTTIYPNMYPPRNCVEAVARWMCPARQNLSASTASVEASGIGCFCCPGYRFFKCCDMRYPTNAVPITVANPMNLDDVQQEVEIS
jgi:hypothetical protein